MTSTDTRRERRALCELLEELGPDQPTLCDGWTTRDLTAHLVLRERRPLAATGIVLPALARYTGRVQRGLADRPYPDLIGLLRRPPWWSPARLDRVDHAMNSLELFVHHEDVRRGQPDWRPRELAADLARTLWSRARTIARLRLRRFPAQVVVIAPGFGEQTAGRGTEPVVITGDPGELTLFLTGRQQVSRTNLAGPDHLTDRLAAAKLGL